ncbi:MAG: hypothetical protein PWP48_560 [Clostridiales bacterium]|nr:hypothetical protein [Clostridiales bacterium]
MVERTTVIFKQILPPLLKKLSKIPDPRQTGKIKYEMTVLLLYGIIMFLLQVSSRRRTNREMTNPIFIENLKITFPELETIPHADTLARLLEDIEDVEQIQECMIELLKDLIRRKKFKNYLCKHQYVIAIDGTQKYSRDYRWSEHCLERHVGKEGEKHAQYYAYVLEAVLILDNGIILPVASELLDNKGYGSETNKQDCERKAFYRIAKKIKSIFPKSRLSIVVDGLYACGPVIRICKQYNWDYMIVLKDNCLKEVWEDAEGIMKLESENCYECDWGNRHQEYRWANDVAYYYGQNGRNKETFDVVICDEEWDEVKRNSDEIEHKKTRYAWISGKTINKYNIFYRCTEMARYRWKIENNILEEKHYGYEYEHCLSYNWNAMKGYHYLMKIAHFINELLVHSELVAEMVKERGVQQFIKDLYEALKGAVLDKEGIQAAISKKRQWRLVPSEFM